MLDPAVPAAWEFGLEPDRALVAPAQGQVLFRIIGHSDPRLRDFQSDKDKERPRFPDQSYVDYLGLSMFERRQLAEENANRFPKIVVAVELQPDQGLTLARTEIEIEGHHAVWGDPHTLLDAVVEGSVSRLDEGG